MENNLVLIGREREKAKLRERIAALQTGQGGIYLVSGEAGMGKTFLVDACLTGFELKVYRGTAREGTTPPYGPIVEVLRAFLRNGKVDFSSCGPLAPYLYILLPELGDKPAEVDGATLLEALRCAFETVAGEAETIIILDDLHWADNATLELLAELSFSFQVARLLVLGVYRSDEVPRGHPLRRLRNELRRQRQYDELTIEAFSPAETGLFASRQFGEPLHPALSNLVYDQTQGVPFFIEELVRALKARDMVRPGEEGLEIIQGGAVPVPGSVRDAVLLRLDRLTAEARQILEVAAVMGSEFSLPMAVELAGGDAGLDEAMQSELIFESNPGQGAFRHKLTHEAIYRDINWSQRRLLHRKIASQLETRKAPFEELAEHWLLGGDQDRAREILLQSADASCEIHAYRDAALAGQRALEIWPEGEAEDQRLAALSQLGNCAALCGMLREAVLAWQEVALGHHRAGELKAYAMAERRLATIYELQGAWEGALDAHQQAAEAFANTDHLADAAAERLAQAVHLQSSGHYTKGLEIVLVAIEEAQKSERQDLIARGLGLEGAIRGKLGQSEQGLAAAQEGLSIALASNLTGAAAEIYTRLASVSEQSADYNTAQETYLTAYNFCEAQGESPMAQVCLGCLAVILRQSGEWKKAIELCYQVLASNDAPFVANIVAQGILGSIYTFRGEIKKGKKYLQTSLKESRRLDSVGLEILVVWGLAVNSELEADPETASTHYRYLLDRCSQTEERHYALSPLRWGATFFAAQGMDSEVRFCAETLSTIAAANPNPEALAALAHALGEVAFVDQNPEQAAEQFQQALKLLQAIDIPFERAETQVRTATALALIGEQGEAVELLTRAHQAAQTLGARPLANKAATALASLEESLEKHLGKRAEARRKRAGLTSRQHEVLSLIALGKTNKEIAEEMVLSVRTVDMHVSNILASLDCRSRAEAVAKAGELGLLQDG